MVLDVHSRDVTVELVKSKVTSKYDFDWTAQLRYYWNDDGCVVCGGLCSWARLHELFLLYDLVVGGRMTACVCDYRLAN